MLRIWQILLQNWACYNQFSEGSFLCPILIENCTPLNKILSCLNIASLKKKSGFLNKALRPRSLRSLAPPTAFSRWRRVGLLGKTLVRHRFAYQSLLIKKHLNRKQVNKLDLMIPQVKKFMDLLASVNG